MRDVGAAGLEDFAAVPRPAGLGIAGLGIPLCGGTGGGTADTGAVGARGKAEGNRDTGGGAAAMAYPFSPFTALPLQMPLVELMLTLA